MSSDDIINYVSEQVNFQKLTNSRKKNITMSICDSTKAFDYVDNGIVLKRLQSVESVGSINPFHKNISDSDVG